MDIEIKEKKVLQLIFSAEPATGEEITLLTDGVNIDDEHIEYLLMLGILGNRKGWEYFPSHMIPRLNGIYKAYRFRNIFYIRDIKEKLQILSAKGTPVMLLKGIAMRFYYAPEFPRQMSDFDLAVPEECFHKACQSITAGEQVEVSYAYHSYDIKYLRNDLKIDLHRSPFKIGYGIGDELWDNALSIRCEGLDVLVPSPEDMIVHLMYNRANDIIMGYQSDRRIKALFDCRAVAEKAGGITWEFVAQRARQFGVLNLITDHVRAFSDLYPDILDPETAEKLFPQGKEYRVWKAGIERFKQRRLYKKALNKKALRAKRQSGLQRILQKEQTFSYLLSKYQYYYKPMYCEAGKQIGFPAYLKDTLETSKMRKQFRKKKSGGNINELPT